VALVECPHCTTRVLPGPGGACPSCGGDLAEKKPKSMYVRTTISDVEPLPGICTRCGDATDRLVWLEVSRTRGGVAWPMRILYWIGVVLSFGLAPRLMARIAMRGALPSGASTTTVSRRRVPVCTVCGDAPPLDHADADRGELTFAAQRTFARELRKLRKARQSP
jgi:hypothetical protein